VLAGLDATLNFCYRPDRFPFRLLYEEVDPSALTALQIDGGTLTTVPVDHAVPTIGFRVDHLDRSLGYSCDTLYCPPFVELAHRVNLMIHEGFVTEEHDALSQRTKHGTAGQAGRAAADAQVDRLALVHFYPPYADRLDELVGEARREFAGEIFVPRQFQKVAV
jgi:ribonuclease Z